MKSVFKYAAGLFLAGMLSVFIVTTASAQRGGFHGGGGGFRLGGGSSAFHGTSGINAMHGISSYNGVRSAFGYRTGVGYHAGIGYHAGAFYRPAFGYYGYPHLGFYIGVLPYGYYPFYWGSSLYYYSGGVFYSPYDNGGYQVTDPPVGAAVPTLPEDARPIMIDSVQYYESGGVYYKESVNDQGQKVYVVAGRDGILNTGSNPPDADQSAAYPKVGDMVNQLPDDCRKVVLNGKKYYVSPDDIYYEKVTDPNGNVAYRIASLPDGEQGQ